MNCVILHASLAHVFIALLGGICCPWTKIPEWTSHCTAAACPQRSAQAAQIAQLEDTIADLHTQQQQLQSELAQKAALDDSSLQQLTAAKEEASKAEQNIKELQRVLETQGRELSILQVRCFAAVTSCVDESTLPVQCTQNHVCMSWTASGMPLDQRPLSNSSR